MYLLKFSIKDEDYFLYSGNSFVGGNTWEQAETSYTLNIAKSISVGGFKIMEVDEDTLNKMIGGIPFHVLNVEGGFGIPFEAVKIINA